MQAEHQFHPDPKLVVVVEDDPLQAKRMMFLVEKLGYDVIWHESGENALDELSKGLMPVTVLLDLIMPGIGGLETLKHIREMDPDLPVVITSAQESVTIAVECMRAGAYDYLVKPFQEEELQLALRNAVDKRKMTLELAELREKVRKASSFDRLIGRSEEMRKVFHLLERTLYNDINVLILGESGTGKELVAKAIHHYGTRGAKPFVVVNCAAIPRELVESELFGHEKGAFTGAIQRKLGKFELANTGTIFLDEIGDLEFSTQAKLLRVLQEREFERVGGTNQIPVDVRFVCATKRDLQGMVDDGKFREDLFYRINAFTMSLPPLKERAGDIELLARHLLDKHSQNLGRKDLEGFGIRSLELLEANPWPGNVRQLENAICRAIVLADSKFIEPYDFPADVQTHSPFTIEAPPVVSLGYAAKDDEEVEAHQEDLQVEAIEDFPAFTSPDEMPSLEDLKEWAVRNAYRVCNGNISLAAKKLGLGRATFYRMMDKFELEDKE